jgi:cytochrome c peroxidase
MTSRFDNAGPLGFRRLTLAAGAAVLLAIAPGPAARAAPPHPGGVDPVTDDDYRDGGTPDAAKVELGRLLFFDKELSGNRNISCATCHHPFTATGDGLSLPVGEGGMGLSVTRNTGERQDAIVERVPRNAPAMFNLGASQFTVMFDDGRVAGVPGGFLSPAGFDLPDGLDSALAVQAMFPVTSAAEMAGQSPENPIAQAGAAGDLPEVWALVADRLRALPDYVALFDDVYGIGPDEITFVHAANAIAAFEAAAFRSDDSPFDRYLRGDQAAMSKAAIRGMRLFYGDAGCSGCHAGPFQTDHDFHAIAMPQIGPGKGDGPSGQEDFGRARVTGLAQDRFRFRTRSLRNVALTAPYGHAGAYATLEAVVRHHLDPVAALYRYAYDAGQAVLPSRDDLDATDFAVMDDPALVEAIAAANELAPWPADEDDLADLLAFLRALTDPDALDLRQEVPPSVPSGLPVFD